MIDLGQYIEYLEKLDQDLVFPIGFNRPHSWRGAYEDLAFVVTPNVKVSEMLASAKEALGTTYQGYKGGDFVMREHTEVYFVMYEYAVYDGGQISFLLLRLLHSYAETYVYLQQERSDARPDYDWMLQDYREV